MIRSFRYPLKPTQAQAEVLTHWLAMCCDLYNGALQERREAWRRERRRVTLYDQQRALTEIRATVPGWANAPCHLARSALVRIDRAFKAFFARCERGGRPGYPRFRAKRKYDSCSFGGPRRVENGRVALPKLGLVKVHFYRPLVGKVLDVIIRREADRWFVVFQCDVGAAPKKAPAETIHEDRQVGVDVGLATLAMLSTGNAIANPRHAREAAKKLAAAQRALARKRRGSSSRRRALIRLQRVHAHVRNQRLDTVRKTAASLVSRFDLICFEDLSICRLAAGMFAKSIRDAGWRMLLTAIACKAESAGTHVVAVDPRGTSQECSGCGARVPKDLRERVHRCPHCGLVLDRDVNAARNILARGRRVLGLPATQPVTGEGHCHALAG